MSSPYTVPTGDHYEGTFAVQIGKTEANMTAVGVDRGTPVTIVPAGPGRLAVRPQGSRRATDGDILAAPEVNQDGYVTIVDRAVEWLGLIPGDDIRLYDRPDEGIVIVPGYPDDPFVDVDGEGD